MADKKPKTWRSAARAVLNLAEKRKLQIDRLEDALRTELELRGSVPLEPSGAPKGTHGHWWSPEQFLFAARKLVEGGHPALAVKVLDLEEFALPDQRGISRALLFGRTKPEAATQLEAIARDPNASQDARRRALEELEDVVDVLVALDVSLDFVRDQLKAGDLYQAARLCEEFYGRLARLCSHRNAWWFSHDLAEIARAEARYGPSWGGPSWQ